MQASTMMKEEAKLCASCAICLSDAFKGHFCGRRKWWEPDFWEGDKFHGCGSVGAYKGRCWMQWKHGNEGWAYTGKDGEDMRCNAAMDPKDSGKYCWEKVTERTGFRWGGLIAELGKA